MPVLKEKSKAISPARFNDVGPARQLDRLLANRGWNDKSVLYQSVLESVEVRRTQESYHASAIVISHRVHEDTARCLRLLKAKNGECSEVIFVSNGIPIEELNAIYGIADVFVQLNRNTGAYIARNIGALFACSPIIVFVEDDCVPNDNLISAHIEAHRLFDCISVRGVYEPKTDNPLNALAAHYDLGDQIFPQHVVAEGNSSYRSETFYAVGGWDDEIRFGGGGTDLAFRLLAREPDMRRQIYFPKARIRHDYAVDEEHLARKRNKQKISFERLQRKHGEYRMVRWIYRKYLPSPYSDRIKSPPRLQSEACQSDITVATYSRYKLSLIIVDIGQWPQGESIETILSLRRTDWDIIFIVSPKYNTNNRPDDIRFLVSSGPDVSNVISSAVETARGDVILFVDTATEFTASTIDSHLTLYQKYDVIAVQGSVKSPEGDDRSGHAWYPQYEFPTFANLPVNVSYRRDILLSAIQNPLPGQRIGNAILTANLLAFEPDFRKQIFSPRPAMTWHRLSDKDGAAKKANFLLDRPPYWDDLMTISQSLFGISGIVPLHGNEREPHGRQAIRRFTEEHHFGRAVRQLLKAVSDFPEIVYGHFPLRMWAILDITAISRDLWYGQPSGFCARALFGRYKSKTLGWFTSDRPNKCIDNLVMGPDYLEVSAVRMLTERTQKVRRLLQ